MGMSQNFLAVIDASKKWCPCITIHDLINSELCLSLICTTKIRSLEKTEGVRGPLNPWPSQSGPIVNKASCSIMELISESQFHILKANKQLRVCVYLLTNTIRNQWPTTFDYGVSLIHRYYFSYPSLQSLIYPLNKHILSTY